ncbi:G-type lectin S-receptor-like serine/threonine-protein kinase At1g61440 [Humulus lupulus]|uniref:G-type lectin S-receptor-like serine/threonine-protein kinase At1g61440 n=1 Tax=Humulus lupulus TaxID=3486 RepID=UPI002B40390F|nr:G-type lectin S-receptor-like serine/threonine-protein kinase At1g61440 [Humulus lupulus]
MKNQYCYAIYNISTFQALSQGQTLVSPSQIFELGFFSLNNSANLYIGLWYKQMSTTKVVWVANREKPVKATHFPANVIIGRRGNLELLDGKNSSLWSTKVNLSSTNNSIAVLLDNGDLVIKDGSSGEELWHSFQHPVNAFLPGAKAGFNVKTGERCVLTSWKNDTSDPSHGNFVVGLAPQRPPEAFIWINGTTPYWRSGPWDKSKFTGVPDMNTFFRSPFNILEDVDMGSTYLYLNWYNSSTFLTLVLSSEGVLKIMLKGRGHDWFTNWEAPKTHCDIYGVCGPFGACKSFESSICKCGKGFEPKSFEEWSKGNWTGGGCLRRNKLHYCGKNRSGLASQEGKMDGFWKISNVKLPDLYDFVELGISVDGDNCKKWCLNNCSCVASAFVDGIGCLVWSEGLMDIQGFTFGGEDLFLRLAHAELGESNNVTIARY